MYFENAKGEVWRSYKKKTEFRQAYRPLSDFLVTTNLGGNCVFRDQAESVCGQLLAQRCTKKLLVLTLATSILLPSPVACADLCSDSSANISDTSDII